MTTIPPYSLLIWTPYRRSFCVSSHTLPLAKLNISSPMNPSRWIYSCVTPKIKPRPYNGAVVSLSYFCYSVRVA